jgi:hypothetical protein
MEIAEIFAGDANGNKQKTNLDMMTLFNLWDFGRFVPEREKRPKWCKCLFGYVSPAVAVL